MSSAKEMIHLATHSFESEMGPTTTAFEVVSRSGAVATRHDSVTGTVSMSVTVPPGGMPGQRIEVTAPDGQNIEVVIPQGAIPGSQFELALAGDLEARGKHRWQRALSSKVAVVTGGNSGIGKESAFALVAGGAQVIIACRSVARGEEAAAEIKQRCSELGDLCPEPKVSVMQLDVASFKSVRQFADDFLKLGIPLHILLNNAGIMAPAEYAETEDGIEQQYQVRGLSVP